MAIFEFGCFSGSWFNHLHWVILVLFEASFVGWLSLWKNPWFWGAFIHDVGVYMRVSKNGHPTGRCCQLSSVSKASWPSLKSWLLHFATVAAVAYVSFPYDRIVESPICKPEKTLGCCEAMMTMTDGRFGAPAKYSLHPHQHQHQGRQHPTGAKRERWAPVFRFD